MLAESLFALICLGMLLFIWHYISESAFANALVEAIHAL
jgi:hypothetical protein